MDKIWPIVIVVVVGLFAGFIVWTNIGGDNEDGDNGDVVVGETSQEEVDQKQETLTVEQIGAQLFNVPEDYYSTVNEKITLEQLKNSKVVSNIDEVYKLGSQAYADVRILWVIVIDIDKEDRTLTVARPGSEPLTLYIGKNTPIIYVKEKEEDRSGFSDIKEGNGVNIQARLQHGRGDPLVIRWVIVLD